MVCVLSIASLALAAVSAVSGLVVPRQSPPQGWQTDILEVCPPFGGLELFSRAFRSPINSITIDTWLSIVRDSTDRLSFNSAATRSW
jgi:hypothetical protein